MLDPGHAELPREAERHASGLAALAVLRRGRASPPDRGIGLRVRKGLPLSGGQGGSAASAVAGAVAVQRAARLPARTLGAARGLPRRRGDGRGPARSTTSRRRCSAASCSSARWTRSTWSSSRCRRSCSWCWSGPTSGCAPPMPAPCSRAMCRGPWPCTRRRRWRRSSRRSPRATTRCSAARSTTASPSRPAPALLPGFAEAKAAALAAGALGSSISGSGPDRVRAGAGGASGPGRSRRRWWPPTPPAGRRAESRVGAVDRGGRG